MFPVLGRLAGTVAALLIAAIGAVALSGALPVSVGAGVPCAAAAER